MELSWSTFVLEILNFLVLVWILKRFLYRPVLDVIAKRRGAIEHQLDEARELNDEAQALKEQYGSRLAAWEAERSDARQALAQELDDERSRRLVELSQALEAERQKARVADERQRDEERRAAEHEALRHAASFAGRLLSETCGPELEARLVRLLLSELDELPAEQTERLRDQWGEPPAAIKVTSAFGLDEGQRDELEYALRALTGLDLPVHFDRDPKLLAGLRIAIGAWVLAANARDELAGFAELAVGPR